MMTRENTSPAPTDSRAWRWLRVGLSLILLWHLTAVTIAPFFFASTTGPGVFSPAAAPVMDVFRPYIQAMFLDHGYFFFAPNPGPSHLVRCQIEKDGQEPFEETFPDLKRQWPRLLYHRHFMLSETLNSTFIPSDPPPPQALPAELLAWRNQRDLYEQLQASFRKRLKAEHQADRVELTRVQHRPPAPYEIQELNKKLTDPEFYQDLPESGFSWETP